MLYEYNGKIYVKPLVNKIVEVTVTKKGDEYDVKPGDKFKYITPEIQKEMVQTTVEEAYKRNSKSNKESLGL